MDGVLSVFSLLLPSFLFESYLEFLCAAGMDQDDLPFIQGLSPQSCREQQPKAHRQTATWIWVKDEIVMFESQPEEAARAVQMFSLSFWQRQHQEGKNLEEAGGCLGVEGKRQLLPSRELHKGPLWLLLVYNILWVTMILGALPRCWHTALAGSSETHYSCYIVLVYIARGTTHL